MSYEQKVILTQAQIKASIARLEVPLRKYVWIQERFARTADPQKDLEFRRRFNAFYRIRRNLEWQNLFYGLMSELRGKSPEFGSVLKEIHNRTGRVEASFSSKLVATLDPMQPVIDSVILTGLRLPLPRFGAQNRIELTCDVYKRLRDILTNYLASQQGRNLVKDFRSSFKDVEITEIKILDLVLWQVR